MLKIDTRVLTQNETPFYYYDIPLLEATLSEIQKLINATPIRVHYAVKANCNSHIMRIIAKYGLGADCVSGQEIIHSVDCGFPPLKIFYAGVGKTDKEILIGLDNQIGCFNVESIEELEILSELAQSNDRQARIALRVNPDIDAHTHHYITTGLEENKFGIDMRLLDKAITMAKSLPGIMLEGLHFHIGSQITTMEPYKILCQRINSLAEKYSQQGIEFKYFNVGGGLGIDYDTPDTNPIPDFKAFFETLRDNLKLKEGQEVHCELGRSIVAQCGSLITKVVYVKQGIGRKFVIVDAGMSDLIRPALYGSHHKIDHLTAREDSGEEIYDVVGPICESSDVFGKDEKLPEVRRGDYLAFRSAGAYGEVMSSQYNMRRLPGKVLHEA